MIFRHYFSRRTPLNFFAVFLTALNRPPSLLRLVEVLVSGFFSWLRFFTAPLRALSPIGLFTAISASQSPFERQYMNQKYGSKMQEPSGYGRVEDFLTWEGADARTVENARGPFRGEFERHLLRGAQNPRGAAQDGQGGEVE